ncbi:hypothetical protein ETD86_37370 [Nonomuraea turkmeniaca]|uniref:Uncharacterized protein n=1 Tax=Nonomuraea turkmeniaca TaxID=103838 RepID=A0A5S4F4J6_9ACTN|nr:hypothetical protein [Nonomuraea turkmeniaca]TMR10989.1 hypothetical protein ETD86_37370 [Nonomuraea turkmeniaca]
MTNPGPLARERFVLQDTWPAEHAEQIAADGWSVVNAPRPLIGRITWEGAFLTGIFYAAGPVQEFGERWRRDDATLLTPLSHADILDRMRAVCAEYGTTLEAFAAEYDGAARSLADDLDLPWDETWLVPPVEGEDPR